MYKWSIKIYYKTGSSTGVSKDNFSSYEKCLEDLLRHKNIDTAFRKAYEEEIIGVDFKVERVDK